MRILIAWELGENYGHILSQLPVIRALRTRGHNVLLVVKNIAITKQILHADGIPYIQAPVPRHKQRLEREISSFGDILVLHGFTEPEALSSLTHAWQHLYRLYDPDVVVVNHAPAALFAARLSGIPTAEIGTGFELPPPASPYPCFRPWLKLPEGALARTEQIVLENLNQLCIAQQKAPLEKLIDFMCSTRLLATFPELDHYSERQDAHYLGPLFTLNEGLIVDWPCVHRKNIFVYIRPSEQLASILNTLRHTDANIVCAIPGVATDLKTRYEAPHLHIYDTYLKLEHLLPQCDLAITYAGHGVISACLLAGIPLLVVPTQIEQMLLSKRVRHSGMGLALSFSEVRAHFTDALTRLLTEPAFTNCAQQLASKYKTYDQHKAIEKIVDIIEQLPS